MTTAALLREELCQIYSSYALESAGLQVAELTSSPYEIGRQALDSGVGLIELIASHREAERETALVRDDALMELVAPFEMVVLGYRETIESLRLMNDNLAVVNQAFAHDLRNPIATIAMWANLARRGDWGRSPEMDAVLEQIASVANHTIGLIGDLITYAALDHEDGAPEVLDLNEVAQEVLSSLASAIRESGASIVCTELPAVRGRGARLAHVLQNLIANSIKYRGDEPPRIRLVGSRDGASWTIRCHDNGRGLPPEQREQAFEPFWRGAGTSALGSGLGLAICRRIVTAGGGRIWIEQSSALGTTVAFTVPEGSPTGAVTPPQLDE